MKRTVKLLALLLVGTALQSCGKEGPFLISETGIGPLEQTSKVRDLENLFPSDSIVRDSSALRLGAVNARVDVYEKGGKHLLSLTPNTDSVPGIGTIQIIDPRYMTKNGIGLKSRFKDIERHYEIKKIVTTLGNIVIFPKGSNLYFTMDKKELPGNLRFGNINIEAVQIPPDAKIKFLMIGWDSPSN